MVANVHKYTEGETYNESIMLSLEEIKKVADENELEPALIKTVIDIESNGNGFLKNGKPTILFEGHIFYKLLVKSGKYNISNLLFHYPTIVYPKWTKKYYQGGNQEWRRLEMARCIDVDIANQSTSWGLFQIMGFNYAKCGLNNIKDFVEAMKKSEQSQLNLFIIFLKNNKLLAKLKKHNWKAFALAYNGTGYEQNNYDTRLEIAFNNNTRIYTV